MKKFSKVVAGSVALAAAVAFMLRDARVAKLAKRGIDDVRRRARYTQGQWDGLRYRLQGRFPAPSVSDDVLADRIRSSLGPVERDLDIPHVHVMVNDHLALLHGEVGSYADAVAIEHAVSDVSGVDGVLSYLHPGLTSGDTRPSTGRARAATIPSPGLQRLLVAATEAGAPQGDAVHAVRTVLSAFAERIPNDELEQLGAHLPDDVRMLVAPVRRSGAPRTRTVAELVDAIVVSDGIEVTRGAAITENVIATLRELVPDEAADVAAVLPEDLRLFWLNAVPA